jgi:hypothetical protein
MRKPLTAKAENESKKSGLHSLMIRISAVIIVVAIISSLIIFHPWSLSRTQSVMKGPEVEGNLTYILPSNVSGDAVTSTASNNVNGIIEAFMTNASRFDPAMNGTGYPYMQMNSSIPIGMHQINPNGSFSFNLNNSFYALKDSWLKALPSNDEPNSEAPIMFEVVFTVPNGSMLNVYTEAYPQLFSLFNFSNVFKINHVFNLGSPQEVIQSGNSTGNSTSIGIQQAGTYKPADCLLEQKVYWKQTFSNLISNIHFPLIAFNNRTQAPLQLTNGYFILAGTFGFGKISLSFTSAQGFGSKSSNASNINGWSFTSSTSPTASTNPSNVEYWNAPETVGYSTPKSNGTYNVSYIYLNNVAVQISDYQLIKVLTIVCNGQVTYTDTIAENDWQVQEYVENPSGAQYSIGYGYLPGDFAQAIADLTGNDTSVAGNLSYGQQINFTSVWSNLEGGTNSKLSDITGLLSTSIAGIGIAVAAAAAIAIPPGGGKVATAALIAEIYSMVGFVSSAVALLSSVIVSSYTENYAELLSLHSFYEATFPANVVMNPSTLEIDNINVNVVSPLITIS